MSQSGSHAQQPTLEQLRATVTDIEYDIDKYVCVYNRNLLVETTRIVERLVASHLTSYNTNNNQCNNNNNNNNNNNTS
jgi:hypothetical protein